MNVFFKNFDAFLAMPHQSKRKKASQQNVANGCLRKANEAKIHGYLYYYYYINYSFHCYSLYILFYLCLLRYSALFISSFFISFPLLFISFSFILYFFSSTFYFFFLYIYIYIYISFYFFAYTILISLPI